MKLRKPVRLYCHKFFDPSPFHPKQGVCLSPGYKRRRRSDYHRNKIATDSDCRQACAPDIRLFVSTTSCFAFSTGAKKLKCTIAANPSVDALKMFCISLEMRLNSFRDSALGDMVRATGNDNTYESWHQP
jgi:hypothetical protein